MKLPKARTENLLEQNLKDETLIYDLLINKAFNLNETLSVVYKACGQNLTFDELKRRSKFTDDFIYLALDELKRENLLAEDYRSPFANTNRREIIKKVGLATMIALPLISGLIAPKAIRAASGQQNPGFVNDLNESCDNSTNGGRKNNGQFCQSGGCVWTLGGDACCNNVGGPSTLRSGVSFVTTNSSDESNPTYDIVPENAPAPTCASRYDCCDSSQTPYGTCSYDRLGPTTFEGMIAVRVICDCTCP